MPVSPIAEQQPAATVGLLTFLRLYFACSATYNSVLLVHEPSSREWVTDILHTFTSSQDPAWLTIEVAAAVAEADSTRPAPSAAEFAHQTNTCAKSCWQDPRALIIWLLPVADGRSLRRLRHRFAINERCDNLIVTSGLQVVDWPDLWEYIRAEEIVNIALVADVAKEFESVFKLVHDYMMVIPFGRQHWCSQHLFYDKTREWHGRELLLFMFFEPPSVINLTRTVWDDFGAPFEEYNVGGPYAYAASMIDPFFGSRSRFYGIKKSYQYLSSPDLSVFLAEFMEKPYREDDRRPKWLWYDLLEAAEVADYVGNQTVLSFEAQIYVPPGMYSLQPHEWENYVLCVPNQLHERSTFFEALWRFPLFRVWSIVIGLVTLWRWILRRIQKLGGRSMLDLLFHTSGMSLGTVSTVRVENRPERVLLLFLSVFTMLSGIVCAGLMFQKFTTQVATPDIDSLEQLGQHPALDVWMPEEFAPEIEEWLQARIPNRIIRLDKYIILSMVYARNVSAAYILSESKAAILLGRVEMLDELGYNLFHMLRLTIIQQQVRFVVPEWYIVERLSGLLQHIIEHGLMRYFQTRTEDMLRSWKVVGAHRKGQVFSDADQVLMIPLEELRFVFVIFGLGMVASLVALGGERLVKVLGRKRAERRLGRKSR